MAQYNEISHKELDELLNFIRSDEPVTLDLNITSKFFAMAEAINRKLIQANNASGRRINRLEKKLERFEERRQTENEQGVFTESGLKSTQVITMLLYNLQQLRTYDMCKTKLQHILYEMYASWLYSKRERLFDEHPCVGKYGPYMRNASDFIKSVNEKVPQRVYSQLYERYPAVARFSENAARKYYQESKGSMLKKVTSNNAYTKASPENNNGRLFVEIKDADIYDWKNHAK